MTALKLSPIISFAVIPGRIEDASPKSIGPQECWEKWIPGLRLPRKIASLFCRDGASRNDEERGRALDVPPSPRVPRGRDQERLRRGVLGVAKRLAEGFEQRAVDRIALRVVLGVPL